MAYDKLTLDGKNAIVTEGSRGIGAACARLLASRGAAVAITYSTSSGQAEQVVADICGRGGQAFAVQADAGDVASTKSGVARAMEQLGGGLDILINNAGIAEHGRIGDLSDQSFNKLVDVNIGGVWHTTTAALGHLRDGGRVVIIGSFFSERVPFPGASAYGMTKHAVSGLTKG